MRVCVAVHAPPERHAKARDARGFRTRGCGQRDVALHARHLGVTSLERIGRRRVLGNGERARREPLDAMAGTAVDWFARQHRLPVMRIAVTAFAAIECRIPLHQVRAVTSLAGHSSVLPLQRILREGVVERTTLDRLESPGGVTLGASRREATGVGIIMTVRATAERQWFVDRDCPTLRITATGNALRQVARVARDFGMFAGERIRRAIMRKSRCRFPVMAVVTGVAPGGERSPMFVIVPVT